MVLPLQSEHTEVTDLHTEEASEISQVSQAVLTTVVSRNHTMSSAIVHALRMSQQRAAAPVDHESLDNNPQMPNPQPKRYDGPPR